MKIKIAAIAMMAICVNAKAQNEVSSYFQVNADNGSGYVASKIFLKSHSDYRGAGIFTLGQTNNWFIGNPYTDHANSFMIGVSNNNELNTASSQKSFAKFYLNKDGEVGIGTSDPKAKLDIRNGHLYVGDETFSNPGSWGQTINIDDNVHSRILIEERQTGVQTALWSHMGGNSKVGTISNHDFGIMTRNVARMTIKTNGYVGIGTGNTNPQTPLDVKGIIKTSDNNGNVLFMSSDTNGSYMRAFGSQNINFRNTGGSSMVNFNLADGSGVFKGKVQSSFFSVIGSDHTSKLNSNILQFSRNGYSYIDNNHVGGAIAIRTGGTANVDFIVNSDGKVGIGTTTTGNHKLAVEGSIGAREIKVEASGWSDFVFEKNYNLPTLTEVEKHIKEKGHLKDIPSAKDVEKNGFFLGEMDAKLLQKIEELTLYTLQQEKRLKEQDKKFEKQEKELKELKILVKRLLEK
ncbi:hypothetical protein [Tenacibaculum halocynthiae]|uniref:hypothetical protein n=1 Tax=Tenacibaculum halocynthiae TaxID=1254437 RepID=UPI003893BB21